MWLASRRRLSGEARRGPFGRESRRRSRASRATDGRRLASAGGSQQVRAKPAGQGRQLALEVQRPRVGPREPPPRAPAPPVARIGVGLLAVGPVEDRHRRSLDAGGEFDEAAEAVPDVGEHDQVELAGLCPLQRAPAVDVDVRQLAVQREAVPVERGATLARVAVVQEVRLRIVDHVRARAVPAGRAAGRPRGSPRGDRSGTGPGSVRCAGRAGVSGPAISLGGARPQSSRAGGEIPAFAARRRRRPLSSVSSTVSREALPGEPLARAAARRRDPLRGARPRGPRSRPRRCSRCWRGRRTRPRRRRPPAARRRRGDHRGAGGHRLEHRQPEALAERGVAEHRAAPVELRERRVGDVAEHGRSARRASAAPRSVSPVCQPSAPTTTSGWRACSRAVEAPVGGDEPRQVLARLERPDGEHEARRAAAPRARRSSGAASAGETPSGATAVLPAARGKRCGERVGGRLRDREQRRRAAHGEAERRALDDHRAALRVASPARR